LALIVLLISFCVCIPLLIISLPMSRRIGLVDKPGALKIHAKPIPIAGGIAILLSMTTAVLISGIVRHYYLPVQLLYYFSGGVFLCVIGLWDDVWQIKPRLRLLFEILVALLIAGAGYSVKMSETVWVWYLVSAFFLAGIINAVKMLDGMDGLAGGITLLSTIGFSYVFYRIGLRTPFLMSLALIGSLAAFLFFNFYPAKVFLGDNGSYLLGFMLFLFAAWLVSKPLRMSRLIGIILIIGLPIIDAAIAIVRRLMRGQSPLSGDRSHLYDIFFHRTHSQVKTVLTCYLIQSILIWIGILLIN